MTINSHVSDGILWGLSHEAKYLADQEELLKVIENKTGYSFSGYFRNRKEAALLLEEIRGWVVQNYSKIGRRYSLKALAHHELMALERGLPVSQIQELLSAGVQRYFLEKIFGKESFIRAMNKLHPLGLRSEFFAEGDAVSDRDFSFLLDET